MECLKHSQAKTKSERITMHLKSEKLAYRSETQAAAILQIQLESKVNNLQLQLENFKSEVSETESLRKQVSAS